MMPETSPAAVREGHRISSTRQALKIALPFGIVGTLWIAITSGMPVLLFSNEVKWGDLPWAQMFSGITVVLASSVLLFLLVKEKLEQARAAASQLRLRDQAIEASINSVIITTHEGNQHPIVYVNPAFESITGYTREEVLGQDCRFLLGQDREQAPLDALRAALREGKEGRALLRNYRKDGTLFWNDLHIAPVVGDEGVVTHYVGIQNDVTENVRYQQELEYQANHDTLTGLPNRNLLRDRLEQAMAYAVRYQRKVAVAFIDLDNFKFVNDSQGHQTGDALLKMVAERLNTCVRASDTVSRLGGDEFVLLMSDEGDSNTIVQALDRALATIAQPYRIGESEFNLSCSIGYALYPIHGDSAGVLLQRADIAMYHAKDSGRNNVQIYTPELDSRFLQRMALETDMRAGLEREEFFLCYQPQIGAVDKKIVGVEALVRWRHPQRGLIPPAHFIPIAEETGLIVPLGDWILHRACSDAMDWIKAGLPPTRVSVNLSVRQFLKKDLIDSVRRVLAETGLPHHLLELELTESLIMHNAELFISTLRELKALGIELAVDDFGTGYSSLSYLKRFPIDRLKIDQSFVRDLSVDQDSAAISQAVIQLGHSLGLKVIAEGVENQAQFDYLATQRCDEIQGYLFSKPIPNDELMGFVRAWK